MPFAPNHVLRSLDTGIQSNEGRLILVQNRQRGSGGQRPAGRANRGGGGGFDSNDFHQDVSSTRNLNANRNVNVNTSRNVNVSGGGCCYGNYDNGPNWGGVAAGVAVGAMIGAGCKLCVQLFDVCCTSPDLSTR